MLLLPTHAGINKQIYAKDSSQMRVLKAVPLEGGTVKNFRFKRTLQPVNERIRQQSEWVQQALAGCPSQRGNSLVLPQLSKQCDGTGSGEAIKTQTRPLCPAWRHLFLAHPITPLVPGPDFKGTIQWRSLDPATCNHLGNKTQTARWDGLLSLSRDQS